LLENLKSRARALKKEIIALYFAAKDPRTPWYAKAVALITVAYALSPVDLIPDFVPILGYLDDLIIVPAGIALALRLIPPEVLDQARVQAADSSVERGAGYIGLGIIILIWVIVLIGAIRLMLFLLR